MTVKHLIQECAAWVVVVLLFATKAFFVEKQAIDGLDDALDVPRAFQPVAHGVAPFTDPTEVTLQVERRILLQRDHQRRFDQIEQRIRQLGNLPESSPGQGGMRQNASGLHDHHSASF